MVVESFFYLTLAAAKIVFFFFFHAVFLQKKVKSCKFAGFVWERPERAKENLNEKTENLNEKIENPNEKIKSLIESLYYVYRKLRFTPQKTHIGGGIGKISTLANGKITWERSGGKLS